MPPLLTCRIPYHYISYRFAQTVIVLRPMLGSSIIFNLLFLFCKAAISTSEDVVTSEHVYIVNSQRSKYDDILVEDQRTNICGQVDDSTNCHVLSVNYISECEGCWAIWPLLNKISALYKASWYIVLEPQTTLDISKLTEFMARRDPDQLAWFGYGLVDNTLTIIHHFYGYDHSSDQPTFEYPDFSAGIVMSRGLVKRLTQILSTKSLFNQFTIDPKHELARYIFENVNIRLTSLPDQFCLLPFPESNAACVTRFENSAPKASGVQLADYNIYVAVKTFSGFHRTRLVVLKRTWSRDLPNIEYVSDVEDRYVPTITVGVNNTVRGHCGKTFAILRRFLNLRFESEVKWLVIADDDTLLSVPRLLKHLELYDPTDKLIIGERYGFGFTVDGRGGYDYPTGGSGMVFSRSAVEAMLEKCDCPADDSPDDMVIGMCARSTGVPVMHSAAFHQARHMDYAADYIKKMRPISFHKFEDIDPYADYMNYLDNDYMKSSHEEL